MRPAASTRAHVRRSAFLVPAAMRMVPGVLLAFFTMALCVGSAFVLNAPARPIPAAMLIPTIHRPSTLTSFADLDDGIE
jgi:hypothetical protein